MTKKKPKQPEVIVRKPVKKEEVGRSMRRGLADATAEEPDCQYDFTASREEFEAAKWLLETLEKVCENGGVNAKRAALFRRVLQRQGDHMQRLHIRIHELEHAEESLADFRPGHEELN